MTSTTIKVPSELRDRLNAEARKEGRTVAEVIEKLLQERGRAERFRAIREFRATQTPEQMADLQAEYREFESLNVEPPEW
ncbi:MAG: ribbon-helix-helix protein, CopG family [Ilumatobacteraceae bacterium]|nr:ribbon-helix-helix protein, CopG family [Ilumatobacteraceae bacterium]